MSGGSTGRRPPVVIPDGPSTSSAPSNAAPASSSGSRGGSRVVLPGQGAAQQGGGARVVHGPTSSTILVNACQKGNPIIQHIRSVAWEYADIVPDYQVGQTTGVLYLSLRYHRLHPEYIHGRISKLGRAYQLRVLLISVDVEDHQEVLKELMKIAIINDLTIMLAWSSQEAGRYLEIYKTFERKGPEMIKERRDNDYGSHMNAVLTNVRGVNKTDVLTLTSHFGSLKDIILASGDDLLSCPGLGEKKVKRLREGFTAPFVVKKRKSNAERRGEVGPDLN